jgi:hypothetical protein
MNRRRLAGRRRKPPASRRARVKSAADPDPVI